MLAKFKAMVENEAGLKIKTLRSNNGVEPLSHQFQDFLQETVVQHQLTSQYSPHKNGVSERKNRVALNMARFLLFEKKIQKFLCSEAINIATYLQNR